MRNVPNHLLDQNLAEMLPRSLHPDRRKFFNSMFGIIKNKYVIEWILFMFMVMFTIYGEMKPFEQRNLKGFFKNFLSFKLLKTVENE